MKELALQEYISALVDEQKAGLCGCESMYLHFLVREDPVLQVLFRQLVSVKLLLSSRRRVAPCPQPVSQRIHKDIRQLYLSTCRTLALRG
jgi:hypothetical protein